MFSRRKPSLSTLLKGHRIVKMPSIRELCFLRILLSRAATSLSVSQTPGFQIATNETFGAFQVRNRCPLASQWVDFGGHYYDGKSFQRVNIEFSSGVSRRQPVSQEEMKAVVTCYAEFAKYITDLAHLGLELRSILLREKNLD